MLGLGDVRTLSQLDGALGQPAQIANVLVAAGDGAPVFFLDLTAGKEGRYAFDKPLCDLGMFLVKEVTGQRK